MQPLESAKDFVIVRFGQSPTLKQTLLEELSQSALGYTKLRRHQFSALMNYHRERQKILKGKLKWKDKQNQTAQNQ